MELLSSAKSPAIQFPDTQWSFNADSILKKITRMTMNYKFVMDMSNQFYLCPIENVVEKSQKNKINQQLIDACRVGHIETVIDLIEHHGADLHLAKTETCLKFNPQGDNPLHVATANGYNDIVDYLIRQGADVHFTNKRYVAPIHTAVFKGRIDTVKLLLDKGAHIETKEDEGDTPLAWASYTGYSKIVEFLIQQGSNIHNKNNLDYTPLHWACYIGHLSVVKILVENGANIFAVNTYDETPVCCASNCGRDDVYAYLLKVAAKEKRFRIITGGVS